MRDPMSMKCMQPVLARARELCVTIDESCLPEDIAIGAPRGYVWACNGYRTVFAPASSIYGSDFVGACRSILEDMQMGIRPADDDEIEAIEWEYDEPWRI